MRRLVFSTIVAFGLVMVGSSGASADDPTPAPTVSAKATPGKKLCKIGDPNLSEISGLVATKSGYVAVNDGADDSGAGREQVFFLNNQCKVVDKVAFSGSGPADTEDIVLSPDGETLWIADTGDNGVRDSPPDPRPTVGLWSMKADGSDKPKLHRLSYPNGDAHDAEALLLNGDGTPLIVTKEIGKPAGIYQPTAALKVNNSSGVPMKRVGEITLSATETAGNRVARIGNKTITGGAIAPGGGRVVLRTYTDALEWDVTNGDVLSALKKVPRTTGLPNEQFGEAISYSADGKTFLTISDMSGDTATANHIRQYTPATELAKKSDKQGSDTTGTPWYYSPDNLMYAVGGVGLLGLLLVGAGVFGIVRFRKSPQATGPLDDALPGGLDKDDPETELIGVGGAPRGTAAYGSGRPGGGGPVYGAGSGPAPGGPQYGRPAGQPPARGPQQQPPRGPQQAPRGPQPQPARGPQQQPPRGPQQQPPRGPQQAPRGPQQQPPRGPQPAPGRGPQQAPGRGPGQVPPRNPQQPPRGPQQQPPGRAPQPPGGGSGVYGGQPQPRGPQQGPGMYGGGRPPGPDNR
ncbi:hypothetical protein [Actinoplanes flavus]|uniref:Uncharacterized protein n=1 Tax=Actinoplanes flavus TaxID=2820290 RepID=A0ABS3UBE5_9ACTN|nr:hypothetical protein [Actinoplanes flavus]MBO3736094.1 hypothetical protein [Actinoplanes flavus]